MKKLIPFHFTIEEINVIADALNSMPHGKVFHIFRNIEMQVFNHANKQKKEKPK